MRLLLGKSIGLANDLIGEGFRVPSGVRKPLMQEPAVGTFRDLWGFVF